MKRENTVAYEVKKMTKEQFYHAYHVLATKHEAHILLESGRDGRYSIAGINPRAILQSTAKGRLDIIWRDGKKEQQHGDPLSLLTAFVDQYKVEKNSNLPMYQGGVLGFISYDYVRHYETLPDSTSAVTNTPDLFFYLFDEWVVYDIEEENAHFMVLDKHEKEPIAVANKWISAISETYVQSANDDLTTDTNELCVSVSDQAFEQMVRDVQAYIQQGDVEQVNLSVRQSKKLTISPLALYAALRKVNPSPYMASIGASTFNVASSSPELLVKKRGNLIETRPIGGTRKRGNTLEEDLYNEQELRSDVKEQTEHLMLVELEKDDFSKVCVEGTVETNELLVIERYSHVMHLVSNIRGCVAPDVTNAEVVKAVFPGGTITGAPKLRTMEIIEELEPEKRGLYTGSIGWFGFDGDFELNVVIRTAFMQDGIVHIQAGAGLVEASNPTAEYHESLAKGRALWKAYEVAKETVE